MDGLDAAGEARTVLSGDEAAAIRAYLQRSEVRLSTIHRVGSALLSGAGLLVIFPVVARDSIVDVVHSLLRAPISASDVALVVATIATIAVPLAALLYLLRDLTRFYFHSNHIRHPSGETFTPRFTLTALRLPADELDGPSNALLAAARRADPAVELLVPANDQSRVAVDRRLAVYDLAPEGQWSDHGRAEALFALAASHPRDLLEEVAKVEHGLARHVLRIQTIVLRYVKALLALLTTAVAAFAAAAVVDGTTAARTADDAWLAGIALAWTPVVILAVTAPVRWLEGQLRSEGATATAVASDPDLNGVEVVTVRLALVAAVAAAVAMVAALVDDAASATARIGGGLVLVLGLVAVGVVVWRWPGRSALVQLRADPGPAA